MTYSTVSISRISEYSRGGQLDGTLVEVRVLASDGEFMQAITLDDVSELVTLRDALSAYIHDNNLEPHDNEQ